MSARRFISARAVTARGRYLHGLEKMEGEERRDQGNRRMTRQRAVKVLKGTPCLMDFQSMSACDCRMYPHAKSPSKASSHL